MNCIIQAVGMTVVSFATLVFVLLSTVIIYTACSLPSGMDSRVYWEREGAAFDTLDVSLVVSNKLESSGRRVVVLNSVWGFVTRTNFKKESTLLDVIPVSQFFKSDFASVPFPANRIINPFGRHAEAAVIHDWLYAVGAKNSWGEEERKFADLVFYDAMRRLGVNWLRRRIMYAAVRLFAKGVYSRSEDWKESFYEPFTGEDLEEECIIEAPKEVFAEKSVATKLFLANVPFKREKSEENDLEWQDITLRGFLKDGTVPFDKIWEETFSIHSCQNDMYDKMYNRYNSEIADLNRKIVENMPDRLLQKSTSQGQGREYKDPYEITEHDGLDSWLEKGTRMNPILFSTFDEDLLKTLLRDEVQYP